MGDEKTPEQLAEDVKTLTEFKTKAESDLKERDTKIKEYSDTLAKYKAPDKYTLKLPEKSRLNQDDITRISSFAKEKGLTNDVAQYILDREESAITTFYKGQMEAFEKERNQWLEDLKNDAEIGGDNLKPNEELAVRVIEHWGGKDLLKEIQDSGLSSHPKFFKMLVKLGKAMKDDDFKAGTPSEKKDEKTPMQKLLSKTLAIGE